MSCRRDGRAFRGMVQILDSDCHRHGVMNDGLLKRLECKPTWGWHRKIAQNLSSYFGYTRAPIVFWGGKSARGRSHRYAL